MKKPELLAPAGDLEKLITAVDYGADAVYMAGHRGGLRTASKNFTKEQMEEGIAYAHDHGVTVHVTLNILPHEDDLVGMEEYIQELVDLKVDALIISDPGIFQMVRKIAPNMPIHISTQASVTNAETVNFWHNLGAERVVLARELSLEEIRSIREKADPGIELETFCHGAMCISYSGRCLLSSYMTGRDANRGDCSHACRWNYALVEKNRPDDAYEIVEDEKGSYILNSKDLCTLPHLRDMLEAGVSSFKIEGRVKSPYYVATVVRAYRIALDLAVEDKLTDEKIEELVNELRKCSHRDFTTAFLYGKPDETSQNYASAGYTREYDFIAVVTDVREDENAMFVSQRNKFSLGDTLEVLEPGDQEISFVVEQMESEKGEAIESAPHAEQIVKLPYVAGVHPGAMLRRKR